MFLQINVLWIINKNKDPINVKVEMEDRYQHESVLFSQNN